MKGIRIIQRLIFFFALILLSNNSWGQFVHPGGVHSLADLNRMKANVNSNTSPWVDAYNLLITDSKAQKNYTANPNRSVAGGSTSGIRQRAARDATAAYYNLLRWYIKGDTAYANCAIRILNAWSSTVDTVVTGELFQIPTMMFVQAAEIARIYPYWSTTDFNRFKNMCLNYFYPACHDFLGECGSWPGWDMPALNTILFIGVLCDDQAKFDEAISYYKTGIGGGNINNFIINTNGQVSEMGRDQPHAIIGPGCAAEFCQTAWNQGVDLFSYSNNRLLSGVEYYCKYNLNYPVNWTYYNDCKNNNFYFPSTRFSKRIPNNPQLEIVYNHYVVRMGLVAPYTKAMLRLRGIYPTQGEYSGYSALTYTLDAAQSPFTALSIPSPPVNLITKSCLGRVELYWSKPTGDSVSGYIIKRSPSIGGTYTNIDTIDYETSTIYIDSTVLSGITYYYKIASLNNAGVSSNSLAASAMSVGGTTSLPTNWMLADIGTVATASSVLYSSASDTSFILTGSGSSFGNNVPDAYSFLYLNVKGNSTIVARLHKADYSGTGADRIGIIMRESLDPQAKIASIGVHDVECRKAWFSVRDSYAAKATWTAGDTHTWLPTWFKMERIGNSFNAYQSQDGNTWFIVSSATIPMSDTSYYIGLYASASSTVTGVTTTAYFDSVSVISNIKSSVLPASIVYFNANLTNQNTVLLKFESKSETNNNYFLINKSCDGVNYLLLNKVMAKNIASVYEQLDENPCNGISYYQLIQVDKDGKQKNLGTRMVHVISKNKLSILPNPVNGNTFVIRGLYLFNNKVKIYSTDGRLLFSKQYNNIQNNEVTIVLNKLLPKGMYILSVNDTTFSNLVVQ